MDHVVLLQRNGQWQAPIIGGAGEYKSQALIGDPARSHEYGPAPTEIRFVDWEPGPARDPEVRASEWVGPTDKRGQIRLDLQVIQRGS